MSTQEKKPASAFSRISEFSGEYQASIATRELAQLVIEVLDAQKKYFKTRDRDDLIASKQLEKRLRDRAVIFL